MHSQTRLEDNTALNAIRLICSDDSEVGSAEGRLGVWTEEVRCQSDGDYITAVKIKTEEWLGWGGATRLLCSQPILVSLEPHQRLCH